MRDSARIVSKAMGRSGLYTKSQRRSTKMETSMKNQKVRIAPADRT